MKKIDDSGKEVSECPSCKKSRVIYPHSGNGDDTLCLKTGKKWKYWKTIEKFPEWCPLNSIQ